MCLPQIQQIENCVDQGLHWLHNSLSDSHTCDRDQDNYHTHAPNNPVIAHDKGIGRSIKNLGKKLVYHPFAFIGNALRFVTYFVLAILTLLACPLLGTAPFKLCCRRSWKNLTFMCVNLSLGYQGGSTASIVTRTSLPQDIPIATPSDLETAATVTTQTIDVHDAPHVLPVQHEVSPHSSQRERTIELPGKNEKDAEDVETPSSAVTAPAVAVHNTLSFVPAMYQFSTMPHNGAHPEEVVPFRLNNRPGLTFPDEDRMVREFMECFPTYHDFMEWSLYDENIGYYSSGKVQFGRGGDFSTWPNTASPEFGRIAVEQAYTMWQSMLTAGDIDENETFTILELGAGNGQLANDMLNAAKLYSQSGNQWEKFYSHLQYLIIERSPELQKLQKMRLSKYGDKVIVQTGDARSFGSIPPKSIKGLVFTNELPDAFPVHRTCVQPDGTVLVQIVIPYLNPDNKFLQDYGIDLDQLKVTSNDLKRKFGVFLNDKLFNKIVISNQDLKKIISILNKTILSSNRNFIHCCTIGIPAQFFPEVQAYCKRHQASINLLKPPTHMNVNLGMRTFIKNIALILDKGFMTTIDYGYEDRHWALPLCDIVRVPRSYPEFTSDMTHISRCDITTDVPWTQFSREGEEDFDVQFLGEQPALGDLAHPRWSESGDFKMHVQRIKGTKASYQPPRGG